MSRPRRDYRTASLENYRKWKAKDKKLSKGVTYKMFLAVIDTYNTAIIDHMVATGEEVKLPHGIGKIGIYRFKPRTHVKKIDFKRTKELGYRVFLTNFHSDGMDIKPKWDFKTSRVSQSRIFTFKISRYFHRCIPTELKEKSSKEVEKYRKYINHSIKKFFK